ncbi:uncharacterized protein LOC131681561 [Topomyia yanbarensis]|uniref:uncharacterized protein LOC131681561 n=1 Tax=Topomyia yanbarensis TaxID=2498891 RepID=UPI00273BFA12|nr:uncharacterized protein LOC131681561 [Topomyia yanbarensis]
MDMTDKGESNNASENDEALNYIKNLLNDAGTIPIDVDLDTYEIHLPPWYDEEKFKRGQQFYIRNMAGTMTAALCGLIAVFAIPAILDVLMFTNKSSVPETAYRRYVLTILHTLNWYWEELKPGSNGWKSLEYVRRIHVVSSKQANAKTSKMLISQQVMAITQFGFIGYVMISHQKLGIQYDEDGAEGFVHFWRTIGYMLGIQDRYNLCTDSVAQSKRRMEVMNELIIRPALQVSSTDFKHMTKAMVDGLWCFSTFMEYDAFMFLTRRLSNTPGHYYWHNEPHDTSKAVYKELGWYSRIMLNIILVIHEILLNYAVLRWYFNWHGHINTYVVNRYFPWLAMLKYGIKNAYVRIVY